MNYGQMQQGVGKFLSGWTSDSVSSGILSQFCITEGENRVLRKTFLLGMEEAPGDCRLHDCFPRLVLSV